MLIQFAVRLPARANPFARALALGVAAAGLLAACGSQQSEPAPPPAGLPETAGRVDAQRVLALQGEPGQWLTGGRDFGKTHYSPLDTIDRDNVARLGFAWELQTGTNR